MPPWLIIGIGSFIGGILRYWVSWMGPKQCSYFPPGNACCEFYRQLGFELDNVSF